MTVTGHTVVQDRSVLVDSPYGADLPQIGVGQEDRFNENA